MIFDSSLISVARSLLRNVTLQIAQGIGVARIVDWSVEAGGAESSDLGISFQKKWPVSERGNEPRWRGKLKKWLCCGYECRWV